MGGLITLAYQPSMFVVGAVVAAALALLLVALWAAWRSSWRRDRWMRFKAWRLLRKSPARYRSWLDDREVTTLWSVFFPPAPAMRIQFHRPTHRVRMPTFFPYMETSRGFERIPGSRDLTEEELTELRERWRTAVKNRVFVDDIDISGYVKDVRIHRPKP